jgi:hypothetical protein
MLLASLAAARAPEESDPIQRDLRAVAWGVFWGLEAGLVSGLNYLCVLVIVLSLVLRIRLRTFALAWLVAAITAWAALPLTYVVGQHLLDDMRLGALVAVLGQGLWSGLLGLDQFALMGGVAAGTPLSMIAAFTAHRAGRRLLLRKLAQLHSQAAHQAKQVSKIFQPSASLGSRVLDRITWALFGPVTIEQYSETAAARPDGGRRDGARWRWGLAALLLLTSGTGPYWVGPMLTERALLDALSTVNRAEVNAGKMQLDLVGGTAEIEDLQIADPGQLDRDRLRIGEVRAKFDPGALVRGRLVIADLTLEGLKRHVPRTQAAKAYGRNYPPIESSASPAFIDRREMSDPIEVHLADIVRDWDVTRARIEACQELLAQIESLAQQESGHRERGTSRKSWREMARSRSRLGCTEPRVVVRQLRAKGVELGGIVGEKAVVKVSDLTSAPQWMDRPTEVEILEPESDTQVKARLNLHRPEGLHEVEFRSTNRELAEMFEPGPRNKVVTNHGRADVRGRGLIGGNKVDVDFEVQLTELAAQVEATKPIAGLSPEVWNAGLSELQTLRTRGRVVGDLRSPKLQVSASQLGRDYAMEAYTQGKTELVEVIHQEMVHGPGSALAASDQAESALAETPAVEADVAEETGLAAAEIEGDEALPAEDLQDAPHVAAGPVNSVPVVGRPVGTGAVDEAPIRSAGHAGEWRPEPPVSQRMRLLARQGDLWRTKSQSLDPELLELEVELSEPARPKRPAPDVHEILTRRDEPAVDAPTPESEQLWPLPPVAQSVGTIPARNSNMAPHAWENSPARPGGPVVTGPSVAQSPTPASPETREAIAGLESSSTASRWTQKLKGLFVAERVDTPEMPVPAVEPKKVEKKSVAKKGTASDPGDIPGKESLPWYQRLWR